jgi:translation initiation factor 1A
MPKADKSRKNGSSRQVKENVKENVLLSKDVEGTTYGHVTKILGDCNFTVYCFDGKERLCHLRGAVKRGKDRKIEIDAIVLVGLRDFQEGKADIVYLYSKDQVSQLKNLKEIPSKIISATGMDAVIDNDENDETGFDFNEI